MLLTSENRKVQNLSFQVIELENENSGQTERIKFIKQELYESKYNFNQNIVSSPDKLSIDKLFKDKKFSMDQAESRSVTSNEDSPIENQSVNVKIELDPEEEINIIIQQTF